MRSQVSVSLREGCLAATQLGPSILFRRQTFLLPLGSIHKVRTQIFRLFGPPPPLSYAFHATYQCYPYAKLGISLTPPPPPQRVRTLWMVPNVKEIANASLFNRKCSTLSDDRPSDGRRKYVDFTPRFAVRKRQGQSDRRCHPGR